MRIRLWSPLYYVYHQEPQNIFVGNYLGRYITFISRAGYRLQQTAREAENRAVKLRGWH